jgi:hypothetical protein
MNKVFTSLFKAALFGTVIATVPFKSDAQVSESLDRKAAGKNVSIWDRLEISGGETFGNASVNTYTRILDPVTNIRSGNTTGKSFSYRSVSGYAAVYFPLSYIGQNSMLALNTGLYFTTNSWDLGNTSLDPNNIVNNTASEKYIGVPIGVDFIYGGEATFNKQNKVTLRGGVGAMPYFAMGKLEDGSEKYSKLGLQPYAKAELGFFLGVEWKIRGMVAIGTRTLYDYHAGDYNLNESSYYVANSFKVRSSYTIGLAVFPFSMHWENDKW